VAELPRSLAPNFKKLAQKFYGLSAIIRAKKPAQSQNYLFKLIFFVNPIPTFPILKKVGLLKLKAQK
jgi:hypothetical protein